jgi:hypothetical protein
MEPSGRNQWQPVANARPRKSPETGKSVAIGCDQLPLNHGKEGVDGSSPSEGFLKIPAEGLVTLAIQTTFRSGDELQPSSLTTSSHAASRDIAAHSRRPESPPSESGRAGASLSLRDWDTHKRSGTALGVLRLASVEALRVFRRRAGRVG